MSMWIATISRQSSGWTRLRWPETLASVRWNFGESTGQWQRIAGGAIGGLFVGLLAPYVFHAYYEFPIGLALCALVTAVLCWKNGMNASHLNSGERVRDVHVTEDTLAVDLADGRTIIVPLTWYPRLLSATMEQRSRWEVSGAGYGIHWPDIDEDLSTEGLLRGAPAAAEPARLGR